MNDDPRSLDDQYVGNALRASEARFRNIIEASADGIVVVNMDGVIAFVNPAATFLLSRPAEELVGRVFGVPVVVGGTTEIDVPRAGADSRIAELRVVQTEWEGRPALLASLRDITTRKRLEEKLRRQAEQLAEADQRKDRFLAMLAHELRNPLAPIVTAAQLMRLRPDDRAVMSRMQDVVEHQANHIARLVDDLLDVSRFTRGKIRLRKESFSLTAMIVEAVDTARTIVASSGRSLSAEVGDDPLWVNADRTRINQVLANLLDNALKYTQNGGTIRLRAQRQENEAVVSVRDDGVGISVEMLPRIFDLFAQADTSLDRSRGGLGIGLTLVKSLVAMHGGSITAQSAGPGQGSEFVVRLPIATEVRPDSPRPSPPASRPTTTPRRVLVVDDNKFAADGLASLLEQSGHQTRVAYGALEALESAGQFQPEVVLLDIGLPEMDGFEVARRLRRLGLPTEMTLVAVTGYGHDEIVQKSADAGFGHHMVKPLDLEALLELLSHFKHENEPQS